MAFITQENIINRVSFAICLKLSQLNFFIINIIFAQLTFYQRSFIVFVNNITYFHAIRRFSGLM